MAINVTRELHKFAIAGLGWSPNVNKLTRIITNNTKQRAVLRNASTAMDSWRQAAIPLI